MTGTMTMYSNCSIMSVTTREPVNGRPTVSVDNQPTFVIPETLLVMLSLHLVFDMKRIETQPLCTI